MYRGLAVPEMLSNSEEVLASLSEVPSVELQSWRQAAPFGSYLWTVKPPGIWVVAMRLDENVVVSNPNVPLHYDLGPDEAMAEVRWDKIYAMLKRHKAALLCRLDPMVGLIAVATAGPDSPWLPLMPGYKAEVKMPQEVIDSVGVGLRSESIKLSLTEADLRNMSSDRKEWPEGLQEPSVIHMSSIQGLSITEQREEWLTKYPEGVWLLSVQGGKMNIFEVLS